MMKYPGFGMCGYRSFGAAVQYFYPLRKVNFIVGRNDSGKSNVLRFVHSYLKEIGPAPGPLDFHKGEEGRLPLLWVPIQVDEEHIAKRINEAAGQRAENFHLIGYAQSALRIFGQCENLNAPGYPGIAWIKYEAVRVKNRSDQITWQRDGGQVAALVKHMQNAGSSLSSAVELVAGQSRGVNDYAGNTSALVDWLVGGSIFPNVESIDAFRRIQAHEGSEEDFNEEVSVSIGDSLNGVGLIKRLQALERPDISNMGDKEKFERITEFVRAVLDDPHASIEIPGHAREIYVDRSGRVLPLANLGTGVHQVVILAAAATLLEDKLVCIEEPEIHLHPLLQRKLVTYLDEGTSNQYLIATHSAHLLDYTKSTIFHIKNLGTYSTVARAGTPHSVSTVCADLGYRASDLLQANAVVWVEGPSDRIYLNHWLRLLAPQFTEGIDYSIMFYGGRLLNHLSAHDADVDDFISLRRLNRHSSILIDSDKKTPRHRINATKRRICEEFRADDSPGFAWVTAGRTIENYVPLEILKAALSDLYPAAFARYSGNRWDDPLELSGARKVDKVKLARLVCSRWPEAEIDSLDMRKQIRALSTIIELAN